MPTCKQCGKYFPYAKMIDGKRISLNHRSRCLECFPLGAKTRKETIKNGLRCVICDKELINDQTRFCSSRCKSRQGYKNWHKNHHTSPRVLKTKEEKLEWRRSYTKKVFDERDRIFGTKCYFCGYNNHLDLHRKSGEKHRANFDWIRKAVKEPNDWVRLCGKCHTGVHFCMSTLKMSWDDIEKLKCQQQE